MLKHFLKKNWLEFIGTPTPAEIQLLTITSCPQFYGNNIILVFVNRRATPICVIKACRNPDFGFKLKREYSALRAVGRMDAVGRRVPKAYFLGEYEGRAFLIQECIAGTSLFKEVRRCGLTRRTKALIDQAVDLSASVNGTPPTGNKRDALWRMESAFRLSQYEKEFIEAGLSGPRLKEINDICSIDRPDRKSYFSHGDYWQTNIMVHEKKDEIAGIIDWEFACPWTPFPLDIFWFLINLAYCLYDRTRPGATVAESYKWGFFVDMVYLEYSNSLYQRYARQVGVDFSLFWRYLEATLAVMSVRELATYGRSTNMDHVYIDLLKFTMENRKGLSLD